VFMFASFPLKSTMSTVAPAGMLTPPSKLIVALTVHWAGQSSGRFASSVQVNSCAVAAHVIKKMISNNGLRIFMAVSFFKELYFSDGFAGEFRTKASVACARQPLANLPSSLLQSRNTMRWKFAGTSNSGLKKFHLILHLAAADG